MTRVKKSTGGGAPTLDILAARLRIEEAELFLEPQEVNLDNGRSFVSDPNLNCKLVVVKNMVEPGTHEDLGRTRVGSAAVRGHPSKAARPVTS